LRWHIRSCVRVIIIPLLLAAPRSDGDRSAVSSIARRDRGGGEGGLDDTRFRLCVCADQPTGETRVD